MDDFWEHIVKLTYGKHVIYERDNNRDNFDNFSNKTTLNCEIIKKEVLDDARQR